MNPDYPLVSVPSMEHLMAIAVAMEAEAARRYEQLARRLEGAGAAEMAELFLCLARLEREHEHGLKSWARRDGLVPPQPPLLPWKLPETFGDEAESETLSPYRALALAVRNEERAFAFYAYLAAICARQPRVRARAEALAREELRHVDMLRAFRRAAFHRTGTSAEKGR